MLTIKIINLNIHKGMGWHRFKSTFQELNAALRDAKPDLIFFQEILGKQAETLILDSWPHYSYGKNVTHSTDHYGNAILSKFPILFSENFNLSTNQFERRGLLHSIIEVTKTLKIHLLCVHLGLFQNGRDKQLERIAEHVNSFIHKDDPIILAGDFNDWSNRATLPLINGLGLQEAFLHFYGSYARTFPAWAPLLRLDRIYFRKFHVTSAERLIHKTWRSLSDHIGLEVDLSLSEEK
jgi:endonuclease/exonuclease/phosphatase family metal-dependent hydrolase